jgi:hypothetical protein
MHLKSRSVPEHAEPKTNGLVPCVRKNLLVAIRQ